MKHRRSTTAYATTSLLTWMTITGMAQVEPMEAPQAAMEHVRYNVFPGTTYDAAGHANGSGSFFLVSTAGMQPHLRERIFLVSNRHVLEKTGSAVHFTTFAVDVRNGPRVEALQPMRLEIAPREIHYAATAGVDIAAVEVTAGVEQARAVAYLPAISWSDVARYNDWKALPGQRVGAWLCPFKDGTAYVDADFVGGPCVGEVNVVVAALQDGKELDVDATFPIDPRRFHVAIKNVVGNSGSPVYANVVRRRYN